MVPIDTIKKSAEEYVSSKIFTLPQSFEVIEYVVSLLEEKGDLLKTEVKIYLFDCTVQKLFRDYKSNFDYWLRDSEDRQKIIKRLERSYNLFRD